LSQTLNHLWPPVITIVYNWELGGRVKSLGCEWLKKSSAEKTERDKSSNGTGSSTVNLLSAELDGWFDYFLSEDDLVKSYFLWEEITI
jgi:hypothetical protein